MALRVPVNQRSLALFALILGLGLYGQSRGTAQALPLVLASLAVIAYQLFRIGSWLVLRPRLEMVREGLAFSAGGSTALLPWSRVRAVASTAGSGAHDLALSAPAVTALGLRWPGLRVSAAGEYNLLVSGDVLVREAREVGDQIAQAWAEVAADPGSLRTLAETDPGRGVPLLLGDEIAPLQRPPLKLSDTPLTVGLIAVNLVILLAVAWTSGTPSPADFRNYGALVPEDVLAGQWWRLFSAMFLHAGVAHLVLNMVGLFVLGRLLEPIYGRVNLLALYLLAGVGGNLASLLRPEVQSVGASGAIMGLGGALVALRLVGADDPASRQRRRQLGVVGLAFLAPNLIFNFDPRVNWVAHLGGLITGLVLALILRWDHRDQSGRLVPRLVSVVAIGLGILGLALGARGAALALYSH